MHWKPLAEHARETQALLPLVGEKQAREYLQTRGGLVQAAFHSPEQWERTRRLMDRAAAFWVAHGWLQENHHTRGVVLLAPRSGEATLRAYWMNQYEQIGNPWDVPARLLSQLSFVSDALTAYGALPVPQPLTDAHMERMHGRSAVVAWWLSMAKDRAQDLQGRLPPCEAKPHERF